MNWRRLFRGKGLACASIVFLFLLLTWITWPIVEVSVHKFETQEIFPSHHLAITENRTWGWEKENYFSLSTQDADGNLYVAGGTQSLEDGAEDLLLVKYAPNGTVLWEQIWGGSHTDTPCALALEGNESILLAGYTESFGAEGEDLFVARFTSSGELDAYTQLNLGGERGERGLCVVSNGSGPVYVGGYHYRMLLGEWYPYAILAKWDANLGLLWQKDYGVGVLDALVMNARGHLYAGGYGMVDDAFVFKVDLAGGVVWSRMWGEPSQLEWIKSLRVGGDGRIYGAGVGTSRAFMLCYSQAGDLAATLSIPQFGYADGQLYGLFNQSLDLTLSESQKEGKAQWLFTWVNPEQNRSYLVEAEYGLEGYTTYEFPEDMLLLSAYYLAARETIVAAGRGTALKGHGIVLWGQFEDLILLHSHREEGSYLVDTAERGAGALVLVIVYSSVVGAGSAARWLLAKHLARQTHYGYLSFTHLRNEFEAQYADYDWVEARLTKEEGFRLYTRKKKETYAERRAKPPS